MLPTMPTYRKCTKLVTDISSINLNSPFPFLLSLLKGPHFVFMYQTNEAINPSIERPSGFLLRGNELDSKPQSQRRE